MSDAIVGADFTLSRFATYPIVGIPFSVAKLLLGVVRLIIAAVTALFSESNRENNEYACLHAKGGFRHFWTSPLEMIPFFGIPVAAYSLAEAAKDVKTSQGGWLKMGWKIITGNIS